MQKTFEKRRPWIWLVILLILFILISYFSFSKQPKPYPNYVSDSPSPTGVKAFYTYLKDKKEVKKWSHSPEHLPKSGEKNLLLMVEPYFFPEKEEMEAYLEFMEKGNTILLFHTNPKGMFDIEIEHIDSNTYTGEDLVVNDNSGTDYRADLYSPVRLQTNEKDKILLEDEAGVLAIKRSYGKGQLIVSNSPEWIINGSILSADHLPLILSLLNEEENTSLLYDEFVHGAENSSTFLTLYPKWFLLLFLQSALIAILWLMSRGRRFGPIFIPREESVRFSDEGIRALSAWYIRGRRYHESLLFQAEYVKLLLQERWGIPVSKEWKDLSAPLERKWTNIPAHEIKTFINELITILQKENVNKQEYLLWSKKLDRLRKEVEES
ncbi:DUF4350 domain-containing protein [Cytobacillus praedii]|uniref:DUF4350 domain-containing protein n=1 Tax=Cytobacillus praedii TaxID=1742358 RepID=UPI002E221A49|nr:DUF4350 domain-containing protein [Cytobacillus praedii]